jgi:L,D-transpeptidase ErfK/SrfK
VVRVPKSIQEEWARAGKVVKQAVPPGPKNPLGGYWIGLSFPSYGIHGTNVPLSIYDFQSRGCIRMHPQDASALFRQVKVGQPGEIIYEPVLLARLQDGRILLEAHRDPYKKKSEDPLQFVRAWAAANNLDRDIDWQKATNVTLLNDGVAHEVGRRSTDFHGNRAIQLHFRHWQKDGNRVAIYRRRGRWAKEIQIETEIDAYEGSKTKILGTIQAAGP